MAKSGAVWGIDIGQCALKALRCRAHEKDTNKIVVEAFDYIEYPKILSQPDADRDELIREAIETFLSRNEVKGDRVAMSVPGQSGLARFIKLPPVEAKKIPDIVKYEARQQIPFALEDVVWDYQPLEGGSQDEGYALETEVGLFAMKRDQVAKALEPLEAAGIEVDIIQLAPLAVYNYACFDRMNNLEDAPPFDPESPPPSKVLLSLGADTTDLVITNGFRVWQRNIPIGGSHFTKALTKELKLTFAKAEHLKRNAKKAEDPKAIFQAMRPVFSDLAAEIQRSLGFFMSNNRGAELEEVIALGNPMKLPGLQRFLSQNLDQEVTPIKEFPGLVGGSVTSTPQFEENQLAFATAYGLCVQGLGLAKLSTDLLPDELITSRLVRGKKPWAVAAAALLMVGMTANYAGYFGAWQTVDVAGDWSGPIKQAETLSRTSSTYTGEFTNLKEQFNTLRTVGDNLQSNADGRLLWPELVKAVDDAVPVDQRPREERERTAKDVTLREELHIQSMDVQHFDDLSTWFTGAVAKYYEEASKSEAYVAARAAEVAAKKKAVDDAEKAERTAAAAAATGAAPAPAPTQPEVVEDEALPLAGSDPAPSPVDDLAGDPAMQDGMAEPGVGGGMGDGMGDQGFGDEATTAGPTGPGYVVELTGHHFHNNNTAVEVDSLSSDEGEDFVRRTLIKNLLEKSIKLPDGPNGELVDVPIAKLGISYPVVVTKGRIETVLYDPEAAFGEDNANRRRGMGEEEADPFAVRKPGVRRQPRDAEPVDPEAGLWKLRRYDFKLQFLWQPTPRHERNKPAGEAEFDGTASTGGAGGFAG
ncbi:Competence protein A [Posidoniimonas polymericola]|uniref:Competence protein A n=1 Tax=Posidoniimonas polymericola TaxID=2528002 RepID=A0A5C5YCY1_9BACT|nr:pilus assembly protein PilM [Posidoniimonas polymericola]TWT73556.1 Competence protein A [Posidoniimonas polymericola]